MLTSAQVKIYNRLGTAPVPQKDLQCWRSTGIVLTYELPTTGAALKGIWLEVVHRYWRGTGHPYHPCRKYRIGIHSEAFRTIPIHSGICVRANANHSEKIRKTFYNSFDEKRKKIDPTKSELIRGNNRNESKPIRNQVFNPDQSE